MIKYRRLLTASRAFRLFRGDFEGGRLGHSYLLSGGDRDALMELVKLFACLVHCEGGGERPCLACGPCRHYETLSSANVLLYPREDRIRKDDVADLIEKIGYKSFESGCKIVVLRDADRMDAAVQNKLLKTLEEPPEEVLFFLLAASPDKLLPTVRSRVRPLELETFPTKEIYAELAARYGESEKLREACAASGGWPGTAERSYLDPDFGRISAFVGELLTGCRRPADFVKFSSRFEEIKGCYESFLDLLQIELRDALMRAEGAGDYLLGREPAPSVADSQGLAEAIETVNQCKRKIIANCNAGAAYDMLLLEFIRISDRR